MDRYLSIDIGGSSVKYGLISLNGSALSNGSAPFNGGKPLDGGKPINGSALSNGNLSLSTSACVLESKGKMPVPDSLSGLAGAIAALVGRYSGVGLKGVAVSLPGPIDSASGHAVHGGALKYIKNCNIRQILRGSMALPLTVENDGKCAALGEAWMGELRDVESGVVMVLGTGIGGGIIANGKLLRGAHVSAGEFSFIQTSNEGDLSANSFARQNGVTSFLKKYALASNRADVDGHQFFDLLEAGDMLASEMFQHYCRRIAFQIINLQNILDPERFVISGGISVRQVVTDRIAGAVAQLRDEIMAQNKDFFPEPQVVKSNLGNLSNLYGALKCFLETEQA